MFALSFDGNSELLTKQILLTTFAQREFVIVDFFTSCQARYYGYIILLLRQSFGLVKSTTQIRFWSKYMKQVYSCEWILNKISNFLVPLVITISLFYPISVVCCWHNIFHIQKWCVAKYLKEWTELCKGNTPFQNCCSNVSYMKGTNMWPNKQAKRDGGGY